MLQDVAAPGSGEDVIDFSLPYLLDLMQFNQSILNGINSKLLDRNLASFGGMSSFLSVHTLSPIFCDAYSPISEELPRGMNL